jgi:flagellar motor switch protein FliG
MLAMMPQKAKDVSQAQGDVLATVRRLEEEGKIVIERSEQKFAS